MYIIEAQLPLCHDSVFPIYTLTCMYISDQSVFIGRARNELVGLHEILAHGYVYYIYLLHCWAKKA